MKIIFNFIKSKRILRFIFSGSIGAVTQIIIFSFLHFVCNLWYVFATSIAFCIAVFVSYFMQKIFTFKDKNQDKTRRQFFYFLGSYVSMFLLNLSLMYLFINKLNQHALFAQIVTNVICAFLSFNILKFLIFRKP